MNTFHRFVACAVCIFASTALGDDETGVQRLLYVAEPGIRNYLEYGGHGVLVFDIDDGHRFVRRIPIGGLDDAGQPLNVKGICASNETGRLYVSTLRHLMCINLITDELLWERAYEGGCDRMSISPDGSHIYLPSLESDHWHVVDGETGEVIARIEPMSKAHNTVYSPAGDECYLAGLGSNLLTVADTQTHIAVRTVGPFTHGIRPFTINADQSLVFVNVNECLGFEIGDLRTGDMLHRVEVEGFEQGAVKRHGCPSHGIGMTPDETEIWVCDAHNQRMHIFDATVMPPEQLLSIELREEPGWITFSIDGTLAWPSTGEVIDVATHEIIGTLTDEEGRMVMSEKVLEIDFENGVPVRAGNQFGIGGGWQ
jgi:DNA-binding beta-propeller fold protein YncE